jgi:hypothetical protein
MSDTMTRVQAICACRNITQLCDELDRAPEDMRDGIRDRVQSMEKRITENTRYPNITEGMDNALRNMFNGLRKWDRDEEYNDDLFLDLDDVAEEIADLDASNSNKAPKGRETGETSDELEKKFAKKGTQSGRIPADKPNEANKPKVNELTLNEVLRRKEAAMSFVLDEIYKAPITVLDKNTVRHMAIGDVLNMTKSDRTQQLLRAAYYIGVLRGVGLLHSKLQNGDE